jgi:hypothetical protein
MLLLLAGLACESRLGFEAVSFYPTNGWTDGCTNVQVGGHGFDDDISATVGGNPVTNIVLPDPQEEPLDVGFEFTAVTPPGENGYAPVVVTSGGDSTTLEYGFYYVSCPGPSYIEAVETPVAEGATVTLSGCGFDVGAVTAYLATAKWSGDPKDTKNLFGPFKLTSTCLTASVSFSTQGVPKGDYALYLFDGKAFSPDPTCVDKDTADTAVPCAAPQIVTIGGGTKTGGGK